MTPEQLAAAFTGLALFRYNVPIYVQVAAAYHDADREYLLGKVKSIERNHNGWVWWYTSLDPVNRARYSAAVLVYIEECNPSLMPDLLGEEVDGV